MHHSGESKSNNESVKELLYRSLKDKQGLESTKPHVSYILVCIKSMI